MVRLLAQFDVFKITLEPHIDNLFLINIIIRAWTLIQDILFLVQ